MAAAHINMVSTAAWRDRQKYSKAKVNDSRASHNSTVVQEGVVDVATQQMSVATRTTPIVTQVGLRDILVRHAAVTRSRHSRDTATKLP